MTGQRTRYCLYIPSLRTASAIESGGGTGSSGGGGLDLLLNNQGAHGHPWGGFGFR